MIEKNSNKCSCTQLKFHLWEEKWKSLTWNYQEIAPPILAIKESKREPSEVDFGTVITRANACLNVFHKRWEEISWHRQLIKAFSLNVIIGTWRKVWKLYLDNWCSSEERSGMEQCATAYTPEKNRKKNRKEVSTGVKTAIKNVMW